MKQSFYARYSILIAAVSIFLLPFAVVGALKAKQSNKNDVKNWIPEEYEETQIYRAFRQQFQGEEFILVSWAGCSLGDDRLELLAQKISPPVQVNVRDGDDFTAYDLAKAQRILTNSDGPYKYEDAYFGRWRSDGENRQYMLVWPSEEAAGNPEKPNEDAAIAEIVRPNHPLFKTVLTGTRVVDQMTSPPLDLTRAEAVERLTGTLVGPDRRAAELREFADTPGIEDRVFLRRATRELLGREPTQEEIDSFLADESPRRRDYLIDALLAENMEPGLDNRQTCLVATLTQEALNNKAAAVAAIQDLAITECAIPPDDLHMGGPPVDNVAIDNAGQKSLNTLAGFAVLIGSFISWVSLRNVKLVAIVISAGIYSAILSLSIVWWTGAPVDAILFTMPSLVYVATTSGAIHLTNYYRDVRASGAPAEGAAGKALHHAALPLSLATGTTAVGLLTLCYTELIPIRVFGFYSAVGVVVAAVLLVFYIPAALEIWKPKLNLKPTGHSDDEPVHEMVRGSGFWWRAGEGVLRHHRLIAAACFLVMGLIGWGIFRAETSVQLMRLLSPRERIFADYKFLEEELGPLVPMEIVVSIPRDEEDAGLNFLERMYLIDEIEYQVGELPQIGGTMSTVTFARALDAGQIGLARRSVEAGINKALLSHRDEFLNGDYLAEKRDPTTQNVEELWRISARVSALKNVDYAAFISDLKDAVEPVIGEYRKHGAKGLEVVYTGVVPLVYKAQHSLMDGLVIGFLTDFALVVLVMMIACRDWSAGMVLLFPSALPAVVVFGAMGWIHSFLMQNGWGDLYIDIGYVMAPCVALGVTVDDIVHFMLWYRKGIREGLNRHQSIMLAYRGCARPMYQSWGVIGIGLAIFSLSAFMPTRNFGIMMISMLTVALVGNLLMLPAILAGPGGAIFAWGIRRKQGRQEARRRAMHERAPAEPVRQPVGAAAHEAIPEPHLQSDSIRRQFSGSQAPLGNPTPRSSAS
jgi:predicted RND superfamily exporter protein